MPHLLVCPTEVGRPVCHRDDVTQSIAISYNFSCDRIPSSYPSFVIRCPRALKTLCGRLDIVDHRDDHALINAARHHRHPHRPPERLPLSLDGHKQRVQIPRVAQSLASAPQPPSRVEPEVLTPPPNRLGGHRDAALGQQVLGIAEAETKTMAVPDGVADDLGWNTVSGVAGHVAGHRSTRPAPSFNLAMPQDRRVPATCAIRSIAAANFGRSWSTTVQTTSRSISK